MMTGIELPALKAAVGLAGVALSLYKGGLSGEGVKENKTLESIFGQFVGGVFYDFVKSGGAATYEHLKASYGDSDLSSDHLNHDLQKAARKAQLIATFFAAQYCLERLKTESNPARPEKSLLGKSFDTARSLFAAADSRQTYLKAVIDYLNEELKNIDRAVFTGTLSDEEFRAVFQTYRQATAVATSAAAPENSVSETLKRDICAELETLSIGNADFPFDGEAFSFLTETINQGWEELPAQEILSPHFLTLNLSQPKSSPKGKKYDWFNLVCTFFNEEYKTKARVGAAAQKQLLLDIFHRLDNFGVLDGDGGGGEKLDKMVGQIARFNAELKGIREDLQQANHRLERLNEGQAEMTGLLRQIVPETANPQNFVSLKDFINEKIYGRNEEIRHLLEFLRGNRKHGAIVAPTCFGKTCLIRKFLYKTTGEVEVKPQFRTLFEKIIYLDCRKNSTFDSIVRHFAELRGEILEYKLGEEENFLRLKIFDKLQSEKILLIFDNFESWIDARDKYINSDVSLFLNTFFSSHHQTRAIFVSQGLPHAEKDFTAAVRTLKDIIDELLTGLSREAALELVRKESAFVCQENDEVDLNTVSDARLIDFFEKVYYIPQAIQSMIYYVGDKNISFSAFLREYWEKFMSEESDEKDAHDKIDKKLRPTRALLRLQISRLDNREKDLLSCLAFFDTSVPKELLLDLPNESAIAAAAEAQKRREALNRLAKNRLARSETDEVTEIDDESGESVRINYYSLHSFVRDIIREILPAFEQKNAQLLENMAESVRRKGTRAWDNKLLRKFGFLSECKERIELYLFHTLGRTDRRMDLAGAFGDKAIALGSYPEMAAADADPDEIRQNLLKAEEYCRKSIELEPDNAATYSNLGVVLRRLERPREAEECYRKAIALDATLASAYHNFANLISEDDSRWEEARDYYLRALELNPEYVDAYNNLGLLLYKQSRFPEAETLFLKTIELDPKSYNAYGNLGSLFYEQGELQQAEQYYLKAIELNPKRTNSYYNFANLLYSQNRFREAETYYLKAIESYPANESCHYSLGLLLSNDESRSGEAEASLQRAVALKPDFEDAHFLLGTLILKSGTRPDEAEKHLRKAAELNPDNASVFYNLGILLFKDEKRRGEAEAHFRRAIDLGADSPDAYYGVGLILLNDEERRNQAEEYFRRTIELKPDYVEAHFYLGHLFSEDENRMGEAEAHLRRAIELNPAIAQAHFYLGRLFIEQNRLDEAVKYLETAVSLDENFPEPLVNLASVFKKRGELEKSRKYGEKALALMANDNYYNLACLYSILDEKEKALSNLKIALEQFPRLRDWARKDPDFEWIRNEEEFRKLLDGFDGQ